MTTWTDKLVCAGVCGIKVEDISIMSVRKHLIEAYDGAIFIGGR